PRRVVVFYVDLLALEARGLVAALGEDRQEHDQQHDGEDHAEHERPRVAAHALQAVAGLARGESDVAHGAGSPVSWRNTSSRLGLRTSRSSSRTPSRSAQPRSAYNAFCASAASNEARPPATSTFAPTSEPIRS